MNNSEISKFLIVGLGFAIAFYIAGPVGAGVLALFILLKQS